VLFTAHFDVVPAPESQGWTHTPFGGEISEGYVWGRGAYDDKLVVISILEAAETLLSEGYSPPHTICFAFGADEEVGGSRGAAAIGALLRERGAHFEYLVDEGSVILEDAFHFMRKATALIGIAEKGHVNYALEARGAGGHASEPVSLDAVSRLAGALWALEHKSPFKARIGAGSSDFFREAVQWAAWPYSFLFRFPIFFGPIIVKLLAREPKVGAMLRTTMAFTMLEGSPLENVLPDHATANVNVRLLPGESVESAREKIERAVMRYGVTVEVRNRDQANGPLAESSRASRAYRRVKRALEEIAPDAVVLPYLVTFSTDTRHYLGVVDDVYRLTPVRVTQNELRRMHAADERVSRANVQSCLSFFASLMKDP
jgi:carboxypeptidase PM20D1